jgi:hypothetical protein
MAAVCDRGRDHRLTTRSVSEFGIVGEVSGHVDCVDVHCGDLYYEAEPPQRPPGERRRSYTQIEYDVARELKKPLYLFLATENYGPDECSRMRKRNFSLTHRRAIEQCGDIYYQFTGHGQLGIRIKELRFPARSTEAPRRVVNLSYNSLGPLFSFYLSSGRTFTRRGALVVSVGGLDP